MIDPNQIQSLPGIVRVFESDECWSQPLRMNGAKSKQECNVARIARYNFLNPLRLKYIFGHPRYKNGLAEFIEKAIPEKDDAQFWISTIGRSSEQEWEEFRKRRAEERQTKPDNHVEIHSVPVQKNWKKAMSSSLVRKWV